LKQPHSIWHEVSANGFLELALLSDLVYGITNKHQNSLKENELKKVLEEVEGFDLLDDADSLIPQDKGNDGTTQIHSDISGILKDD
jgi:hypothetical protein